MSERRGGSFAYGIVNTEVAVVRSHAGCNFATYFEKYFSLCRLEPID
jgi:hypothetical protein